jgi:hypothetical protein
MLKRLRQRLLNRLPLPRLRHRRSLLVSILLLGGLLTACNNAPADPVATITAGPPPTLAPTETPQPTATPNPDCRKQELEDWLQASNDHARGLILILNTAVVTPQDRIDEEIGRIEARYQLLKATKVPVCATAHSGAVNTLYDIALLRLNAFKNGESVDMSQVLNEATALYNAAREQDKALRELYQRLPREA